MAAVMASPELLHEKMVHIWEVFAPYLF